MQIDINKSNVDLKKSTLLEGRVNKGNVRYLNLSDESDELIIFY